MSEGSCPTSTRTRQPAQPVLCTDSPAVCTGYPAAQGLTTLTRLGQTYIALALLLLLGALVLSVFALRQPLSQAELEDRARSTLHLEARSAGHFTANEQAEIAAVSDAIGMEQQRQQRLLIGWGVRAAVLSICSACAGIALYQRRWLLVPLLLTSVQALLTIPACLLLIVVLDLGSSDDAALHETPPVTAGHDSLPHSKLLMLTLALLLTGGLGFITSWTIVQQSWQAPPKASTSATTAAPTTPANTSGSPD